ncbi:MAG TPA: glycosyltransferase family 1 protein, partial [Actinomycetes bacterium]|nr:glycosyltransferase family 1 protein [Actinomycetes bacterium]
MVVCGAQKPFVRGGAELLQENLVQAIAAEGHRVELVRLPVAWEKDRLFDSPLAWRLVPVDAGLVIATNFPSYFIRHPRKVVWLLHQHRGAYDAADAAWSDFGP